MTIEEERNYYRAIAEEYQDFKQFIEKKLELTTREELEALDKEFENRDL